MCFKVFILLSGSDLEGCQKHSQLVPFNTCGNTAFNSSDLCVVALRISGSGCSHPQHGLMPRHETNCEVSRCMLQMVPPTSEHNRHPTGAFAGSLLAK